jgi:hypothetical protein
MKLGVESRFYRNPEADVRVTYMQWFGGHGKQLQRIAINISNTSDCCV